VHVVFKGNSNNPWKPYNKINNLESKAGTMERRKKPFCGRWEKLAELGSGRRKKVRFQP